MMFVKPKPIFNEHNYALFENEVKRHFQYLVEDYQFRLSKIVRNGFVKTMRYESKDVYVNIHYGPPAYEVEAAVGRIGIDDVLGGHSFSVGELVTLSTRSDWKEPIQFENKISGEVEFFARLIRLCGSACLVNDQAAFDKLGKNRGNTS